MSPLFLYGPSNSYLLPQNYFNRRHFFLLILLIYFLLTPLHGLAFYSFTYPLCLFPSYLNHTLVYFNQISTTIYLIILYMLRIYKVKLLHKLTTEHTLHSRVKFSLTQSVDCFLPKVVESQSK